MGRPAHRPAERPVDAGHAAGDARWLTVAQRFDHAAVFDPLAANRGQLNGLHANTQAEHFRAPNAIAGYLNKDTCESCNTFNMLLLTRELFALDPTRAA